MQQNVGHAVLSWSLPVHMLRAGIVFGGVCLSAQKLENYWLEIDVTW